MRVFPGHTEFQVLRYAASALRDLDDERAGALRAACRSRRITLLDRIPTEYGTDVTLIHREPGDQGWQSRGPGAGGQPGRGCPRRASDPAHRFPDGRSQRPDRRPDRFSSLVPCWRPRPPFRNCENKRNVPWLSGWSRESDEPRLRHLAAALGVDFHHGGLSTDDLVQLIRGCRSAGSRSPTPVSACSAPGPPARPTWPSRSTPTVSKTWIATPLAILLLQPDLARLGVLDEVTRVHDRRILVAQGSALIPNLFCVAGAFFLGFSSLTTVAITNLGTYSTYARTSAAIRGLEQQLARVSKRRVSRIAS